MLSILFFYFPWQIDLFFVELYINVTPIWLKINYHGFSTEACKLLSSSLFTRLLQCASAITVDFFLQRKRLKFKSHHDLN